MLPHLLLPACLWCASGCSLEDTENQAAPFADVNAAAAAAQGDIASYAGQAAPVAITTPAPAATPLPGPDAGPPAADAARARAVVERYFAALAARDYTRAYALWDGGANPLGPRAFAAQQARYADYRATVGPAGRVDSGAGQRYVTVPVRIAATLRGGTPTETEGAVVLHRTGAIDGATAAQRHWHIRELHLDGGGDAAVDATATATTTGTATGDAAVPPVVRAVYRCGGTTRLSVRFDNVADTASVRVDGRRPNLLRGQRPASGIWYRGGGYELRGKGTAADFTAPGQPAVACTAED